MTFYSIQKR